MVVSRLMELMRLTAATSATASAPDLSKAWKTDSTRAERMVLLIAMVPSRWMAERMDLLILTGVMKDVE